MKKNETLNQRLDDFEVVLENLELHLLQALWNMEETIKVNIESTERLRKQLEIFITTIGGTSCKSNLYK